MGKEIQKWADAAMFAAEPLKADEGPKVYLLEMSHDPLGQIAAACKMYKGEVVRSLKDVTDAERMEYFEQVQRTKLKAPFEFVKFHFLIEGVTRSLTHQMVRQRTAVYAQESLRFAVKENMEESVALPPSLANARSMEEIYEDFERDGFDSLSTVDQQRYRWGVVNQQTERAYRSLIDSGMPAEDARGLLPHNITTRLHYSTDLRALQDHAGNRLCTQAQFEWRLLWTRMVEAIRGYPQELAPDSWQWRELSQIFRPVCYLTGKCEFKANFDRSCKIRERVDQYESAGIPSSQWERGVGNELLQIQPIHPAEWLLDSGAAR